MSILHGKMASSTVFIFAHKVGVNRLWKEAGLIPQNENTPLARRPASGCGKSDVDLAVPLASARWRELARTRLPYRGPVRLRDECERSARTAPYRGHVPAAITARDKSRE